MQGPVTVVNPFVRGGKLFNVITSTSQSFPLVVQVIGGDIKQTSSSTMLNSANQELLFFMKNAAKKVPFSPLTDPALPF